ncbi:MAG: endonuclease [Clostridia bacterium]|nr:endonuclease [Clostridia bacterium]
MKKHIQKSAAFLIAVLMLLALVPQISVAAAQPSYSSSSNMGTRGEICTTLDGTGAEDYYTGIYSYDALDDLSGSELQATLKALMKSTHTYQSSYDDCHYKANKTDCENGNGMVSLIYTSYSATMSQWNGWNREHVWPQSLGGNTKTGGGADLHHIRPSDSGVNSSRGNKKYGESGTNATSKYGTDPAVGVLGGTYNSTYFEPLDSVKGDVARICLYVYVRWNSEWGATSITKVFQSVDVLLEWCALDPVDTWEMGRNEVVEGIQGNRNVFIDYPELAWLLFDREIPEGMTTPSGVTGGTTGGSGTCEHQSTEIRGASMPDCQQDGHTGSTYCSDCGELLSAGSVIPALGHVFGEPEVIVEATEQAGGTVKKVCTVCSSLVFEDTPKLAATEASDNTVVIIAVAAGGGVSALAVLFLVLKKLILKK